MEGPVVKRAKLLAPSVVIGRSDWKLWYSELEKLQVALCTGCLCGSEVIQLHRPVLDSMVTSSELQVNPNFVTDYTLQFLSTLKLLAELAVSQRGIGFICSEVSQMANSACRDEGTWEVVIQLISSSHKFISYSSSKCLASLLLWTKLPDVHGVFDELLENVVVQPPSNLTINSLQVFRTVIEHSDEDEHPLQLLGSGLGGNLKPHCKKIEIEEEEVEADVKELCVKSLEDWWSRMATKFKHLLSNYQDVYESCVLDFLCLWQSIVSVKSGLNVVHTKEFYAYTEQFVPTLTPALPPVIWKKLLDVFNEILCYGSTLSLQESLPQESCDLAHLFLRSVKSRQLLQGVPYEKSFVSFGGSKWVKPSETDPKWESESIEGTSNVHQTVQDGKIKLQEQLLTQSSLRLSENPCSSKSPTAPTEIFIGPSLLSIEEESEDLTSGDLPLLRKVVLLILKCVAVSVRETKEEGDSSDEEEAEEVPGQGSPSDYNDMTIIERSVREVFGSLDSYIKSLLSSYCPSTPLCSWIVRLFSDQDDELIEAMLCTLDSFTSFIGRIDITTDFYNQLNPLTTFQAFVDTISGDKDVIIDLLIGNETCFLLYLLRLLKYITKNWEKFIVSCGTDLEKIMEVFIRLKLSLVNSSHFPYNIDPIIRLLEKCENNYESNGS